MGSMRNGPLFNRDINTKLEEDIAKKTKKMTVYHCQKCKKDFEIKDKLSKGYWNYNCPVCNKISPLKSFGVTFKGLDTVKN